MILAGVAGWAVASNGLRPVRRLTSATERVAVTRELTPIDVSGKEDELARLTRSFNAMLLALDDAQRARAAADRRRRPRAAHAADEPAHQHRPAAARPAASAERQPRRHQPHRELLDDVGAQLDELTTLVGDLIELARDEPLHRDPEPLDLADVVRRAVERVRAARRGRHASTSTARAVPGSSATASCWSAP